MYPHEKEGQKQALWRVDPKQAGLGGTLGDVGSHALNLMEYITNDRVTQICADKSTFLPDRELDEDVNVLLHLNGGGKGGSASKSAHSGPFIPLTTGPPDVSCSRGSGALISRSVFWRYSSRVIVGSGSSCINHFLPFLRCPFS